MDTIRICEHEIIDQKKLKIPDDIITSKNSGKKGEPPQEGFLLNKYANKKDYRWFLKREYEFNSEKKEYEKVYKASYIVGAQWITRDKALIINPKPIFRKLDYMKMLMTCFRDGMASDYFSRIYDINLEEERIETDLGTAILDPLLLCHFLCLVENIAKRGLKKGYVYHSENLKKSRGRINIYKNERKNVLNGRSDRVYCDYSEYEVNTPENRLIKKALLISKNIYSQLSVSNQKSLSPMLNKCLTAFENVDSEIQLSEIKTFKVNKLYKEYSEAIKIAKKILQRSGYSVTESTKNRNLVPPFWIDMPALFEYYLLSLMRKKYGEKIMYQDEWPNGLGRFGLRPDYLFKDDINPMILDAKYIPDLPGNNDKIKEYVQQLSGYSRIAQVRERLGLGEQKEYCVPCVLIYASDVKNDISDFSAIDFTEEGLEEYKIRGLYKFYLVPINLPEL